MCLEQGWALIISVIWLSSSTQWTVFATVNAEMPENHNFNI